MSLGFKILGSVLMPERLHLLIWPGERADPSKIMQSLKERTAGETCALLLAATGRGAPESEAVWQPAENDRGAAAAGQLAKQERAQSSSEVAQGG